MPIFQCKRRTLRASPEKRSRAVGVTRSRMEARTGEKTRACGYPLRVRIATAWHARCAAHRHAKRMAGARSPRGDVLSGPARSFAGRRRARGSAIPRGRHARLPRAAIRHVPDGGSVRPDPDGTPRPRRQPDGLSLQGRLALRRAGHLLAAACLQLALLSSHREGAVVPGIHGRLLRAQFGGLSRHVHGEGPREDLERHPRPAARRLQWNDRDGPEESPDPPRGDRALRGVHAHPTRFAVTPKLGMLLSLAARVLGKRPSSYECVIWMKDVPAFIRCDGPLRLNGPVYRFELIGFR